MLNILNHFISCSPYAVDIINSTNLLDRGDWYSGKLSILTDMHLESSEVFNPASVEKSDSFKD